MPSIPLTLDKFKHFFFVPALIFLDSSISGTIQVTRDETVKFVTCNTLMYIDTGSTLTSITDIEARSLGVDIKTVERELTGGIGGFAWVPCIEKVSFVLQGNNSPVKFTLDRVGINHSKMKQEKTKGKGKSHIVTDTGEFVPLLGIDALKAMKAELVINPIKETGEIRY